MTSGPQGQPSPPDLTKKQARSGKEKPTKTTKQRLWKPQLKTKISGGPGSDIGTGRTALQTEALESKRRSLNTDLVY